MPIYSDSEPMPDWDIAYNAQSTALGEALDAAAQADKDDDAVATIADLPVTGNWAGRVIMVEENDMLYVHDGTGWYIYGGKLPYFFGDRSISDVDGSTAHQGIVTSTTYARGITRDDFTLTFETTGIYRVDLIVGWEPNDTGQRNLGIEGTDITVLGPGLSFLEPHPGSGVTESQILNTYILVTAPGATATPYVVHNAGVALGVFGSVCVMWVSS
ncbi:hypothetical protein J2X63_003166 [Agromyces sp. 3263]|uniref:hypothetical protein n=1 Tax=Agromyces sp. 3263 TaxID=2817750 RepID=UPI0028661AE6|nr:hypothetical protein [Agromyces sp. 3263]MDR6907458.1 hypothetical protein [Agromyces sp. 3263]